MPSRLPGPARRERQKSQRSPQIIKNIDPSTIDTSEPAGPAGSDTSAERSARLRTKITVNDARRRKREGKLLTYPLDMKSDVTDYLEIRVINYKRNGLLNDPGSRTVAENGTSGLNRNNPKDIARLNNVTELLRVIQLPIPSNVQDGNSVNYESSNLNGLTGALAGFTEDLINLNGKNLEELGQSLRTIIGSRSTGLSADVANDLVNKLLVSQAVGVFGGNVTVNQLLAREQGAIFNPNMELLFNGPTLRQFRFSFKMTPRDDKESLQVKKIIREFKQSMAPKVVNQGGNSNLFLRTPNIFELRYRKGTGNHPFLHRFKQCALTDMSVNYTGEGTYATYGDATPVSMIMDLTFKELEPVYDIDYGGDDVNGKFVGPGGVGY
jgi:hypothetical protein